MQRIILITTILVFSVSLLFAQNDTTNNSSMTIPVIVLDGNVLTGEDDSQDLSGLLQSSRDIFTSTAGYTFGSARFKIRGLNSAYTTVMIDGMPLNSMETGSAYWSIWGGLNDATREKDIQTGIGYNNRGFGNIGGLTNIETRASKQRVQTKFSYSMSNRTYRNRLMFVTSTGMMKNNWAITFSGSRRWSQEGYVEGTSYDAYAYFLSIERKLNKNHSIGLTTFGSPVKRGKPGVSTQEAYDLAGSNYYNPYWGYQNGEKRNSRIAHYHTPVVVLTHYWDLADQKKLQTSLNYSYGMGGSTALNWQGANDPRPDYYRNLPSYNEGNTNLYNNAVDRWSNPLNQQLDWDSFYDANRNNPYPIENANGIEGNTVEGNRSFFIVEDRRNDHQQLALRSVFTDKPNDNLTYNLGVHLVQFQGFHYNLIDDLVGGDYWYDIDKYAERDNIDPNAAQSDLNNPNRTVTVGDRFGHDYTSNINKYEAFGQAEYKSGKFDAFAGVKLSSTEFWRTGHYKKGLFPEDSYGESEHHNFVNYAAKGGVTYKVTGRHFITANAAYQTNAPYFRDVYISPRTRDHVVSDMQSEKILTGDINYILRAPNLKARFSAYYTQIKDQSWVRSFYHEDLNSFVNYIMTGVDKLHMGTELGIEAKLTSELTLNIVGATAKYIYNSRPNVTISQDNDREILAENKTVYIKNYRVGGAPQTAASIGLKYYSSKYWFAGVSLNYFDDIYIDINPDRRTEEAVAGYITDSDGWNSILDQEQLPSAFTLDFFGGKSWKIGDNVLGLTISANNVLDNKSFAIGGFEQLRYDKANISKFSNKYYYLYGRNFFINLNYRF